MKIIKHGHKKFQVMCRRCGCVFEYGVKEIGGDGMEGMEGVVRCPECGGRVEHSGANYVIEEGTEGMEEEE